MYLWKVHEASGIQLNTKAKFSWVKKEKKDWWGNAHLKNVLGSLGGIGCGSGLLLLNSISWMGELGMGSRRLGCPLPTPLDSRALRLGTLTNLFVDLSFFFFCCIKNNKYKEGFLYQDSWGNLQIEKFFFLAFWGQREKLDRKESSRDRVDFFFFFFLIVVLLFVLTKTEQHIFFFKFLIKTYYSNQWAHYF